MSTILRAGGAILVAVAATACADRDNPTALADLQADVRLEITTERVETFTEVEIHANVTLGGMALAMETMQLEIETHDGILAVMGMEPDGDGYSAHVIFYGAGEHHLLIMGAPFGHQAGLLTGMASREIEVFAQHRIVGPYWVEMDLSPAPVPEGGEAHIRLRVHEFDGEGPGREVGGVQMHAELHHPDGHEAELVFEEEVPDEYEAPALFPEAGLYEIHLEIEVDEIHHEGEFHIPIFGETVVTDPTDSTGGGHGHGG
jgi:hypothetical protein